MHYAALHIIATRRAIGMSRAQMRAAVIEYLVDDMTDHLIAVADYDTPPSGAPAMPAPPPVALLFEAVA